MTTLEKAIETYGKDMQLTVAVEELSELIKEICKNKRGADNREAIIEEMADCYIMLEQIKIIFDIKNSKIYTVMEEKLERLENRLENRREEAIKCCSNCGNRNSVHCENCVTSYDKVTKTTSTPSHWNPME